MKALITVEAFYVIIGAVFAFMAAQVVTDRTHARRWGTALFWAAGRHVSFRQAAAARRGRLPGAVDGPAGGGAAGAALRGAKADAGRTHGRGGQAGEPLFWPALLVPATAVRARCCWAGSISAAGTGRGEAGDAHRARLGSCWPSGGPAHDGAKVHAPASRAPAAAGHRWALILRRCSRPSADLRAGGVGRSSRSWSRGRCRRSFPSWRWRRIARDDAVHDVHGERLRGLRRHHRRHRLPLIVQQHGGDAAIMAGIGMLSGYCGTLLTPMAANFNIVPQCCSTCRTGTRSSRRRCRSR